jgi:xylulokinase
MHGKIVLVADIGTSSLKAGLIDIAEKSESRLLASFREPYALAGSEGWELAFSRAVTGLLRTFADFDIEAICVSGNGPTLVPMLKNDAALPPIYWFKKTNQTEVQSFFLPHILCFRDQHPEQYEQVVKFCSCQEWLSFKLGAELATILPTPSFTGFYWNAEQCNKTDIDINKFPPFAALGSIIGYTSEKAAAFGLKKNIPIVGGGPDFVMALLGTATVEAGLVCDRAGSSEGINVCVEKPEKVESLRLMPHPIDGLFNVSSVLPESGSIFEKWRKENHFEDADYDELLKTLLPADSSVHPVLQKIADNVKNALYVLENAGFPVKEMRLSGGQAKSPLWVAAKAKILGCKLLVPEIIDGELAGDAAAASLALGEASTIKESCKNIVVIKNQLC